MGLENSIRFSVNKRTLPAQEEKQSWPKLSGVLFVESMVAYIVNLPVEQTGWLAGARDAEVEKALALMHRNPVHPWTIASLAKGVGVSHSVLAEHFRHYLN